jgi:hypothetical protein
MVPRLKISSISPKENISSTYLISITSLSEDEQVSKHGGRGRYNAILEFKGSKRKKRGKMKKICMRKNMSMYKNIYNKDEYVIKCIRNFKNFKIKEPNSSFEPCAIR